MKENASKLESSSINFGAPVVIIENAEIYGPLRLGKKTIVMVHEKILAICDQVDHKVWDNLRIEYEVLDASDCYVTPGFIDPQEMLAGGSGEQGFNSQTPRIELSEIVTAGITTVVGCVGADTVTKTQQALLGCVKSLNAEGLSAYMYCGGYDVPPVCITGSIRSDIILIDEIIGVGEVAISDFRSSEPTTQELARMVSAAYVAGTLTNKAGICRIHVGDEDGRLDKLHELLDNHDIKPESLYPTHIERTPELLVEGAKITNRGVTVDMDTVGDDLFESLKVFLKHDGKISHLTVSSDAGINSPRHLYTEFRRCFLDSKMNLEDLLPIVTTNAARILKLRHKGKIEIGRDADVLVIEKNDFTLRDVIAKGRILFRNRKQEKKEAYLQHYKRDL